MATTKRFSTDVESVAVPKGRPDPTSYLTVAGALLLCVAQVPSARGVSASCVATFSSYVGRARPVAFERKELDYSV
jgi:hypothetical protein